MLLSQSRTTEVVVSLGAQPRRRGRGHVRCGDGPGEGVGGVDRRAVADGDAHAVRAAGRGGVAMVPVMRPGGRADREARRQVAGGVGQGVAVEVGRPGVEADDRALEVGPVAQVLVEGRLLVRCGDRPGEGVGGVDRRAVADGHAHAVGAAGRGPARDGARDEPRGRADREAGGQAGGGVGQGVAVGVGRPGVEADDGALEVWPGRPGPGRRSAPGWCRAVRHGPCRVPESV